MMQRLNTGYDNCQSYKYVQPDGDPVFVPVQGVQKSLLIHSQLNVTELSAPWHQLNL